MPERERRKRKMFKACASTRLCVYTSSRIQRKLVQKRCKNECLSNKEIKIGHVPKKPFFFFKRKA